MKKTIQTIKSVFQTRGVLKIGQILLIWAVMLLYITAVPLSMSENQKFLEDCDKNITCSEEDISMVCATDGKNYTNKCFIELENQNRFCKLGDFNPLAYFHDGEC